MELFGREEELRELRAALRSSVPGDAWITIVGGPGIGKRALAAKALSDRMTCWIDASRVDRTGIEEALAAWEAVGVLGLVIEALETWVDAEVVLLAEALGRTRMVVVALSTRPFALSMETQLRLQPLEVEAATQMLRRGVARLGGGILPEADLALAAQRLRGLPEALALAIPRLALLGLEHVHEGWIAEALRPSFEVWLARLGAGQTRALRMLALFEDGLPSADAERVLRTSVEDLHGLAFASVVRRNQERRRIELFPWLRTFALAHLQVDAADEEETLLAFLRHTPRGGDARRAFAREEQANLLGLLEHASPKVAVAALLQLRWGWFATLQLDEGLKRTARVLERLEEGTHLWLEVFMARLQLEYGVGDSAALQHAHEARACAARLGQRSHEGAATVCEILLGASRETPGTLERAEACHAEFFAVLDPYYRGRLESVRGTLYVARRDARRARGYFRQAAEATLADGDHWLSCDAWAQCAWLAVSTGDDKEARFAVGEATRCERLSGQSNPQLNRVLVEAATLIVEGRSADVERLVAQAFASSSSMHLGALHGLRGIARFIEGDAAGAQRSYEEAIRSGDPRPSIRAYWHFWLATALVSLGANVTAHDAFHAALEMARLDPERSEFTTPLAAIFGARVLGAEGANAVGMEPATALRALRAQLEAGQGSVEARLALFALGHEEKGAPRLRVNTEVSAFEVNGARVTLASGSPQRAVLCALIEAHRRKPGVFMSADELIAAAWPGESHVGDSGMNRLRVAVSRLRKLGLSELIVHRAGGYGLGERTEIEPLRALDMSREGAEIRA